MKLSRLQQLVLRAIRTNPGVQNDDAALNACVWEMQGWDYKKGLYENLRSVARPESIARRRRELHQAGLITYSKDADKKREDAFGKESKGTSWL